MSDTTENQKKPEESVKKSKTIRCEHPECSKKLGLLGFDCRCGHKYCANHRSALDHGCTFDYKQENKKELLKYMSSPVIGPKVVII